jgi:hypothetical protein
VVPVGPAFLLVARVPFTLQNPEDGQDGSIGETIGEPALNLGDGTGSDPPQDTHHVQLSIRENDFHSAASFLLLRA